VNVMYKTLLRIWLILWVVTLPLVHIHPEADHAHGMSGHVHGGTYHSILVNTPVHAHQGYEQEEHDHDGFFSPGDAFGSSHSPSHPPYEFEETTYGFSVLKPSIDLESEKTEFSRDVVVAENIELLGMTSVLQEDFISPKSLFSSFPNTLSPRAPPVFFI